MASLTTLSYKVNISKLELLARYPHNGQPYVLGKLHSLLVAALSLLSDNVPVAPRKFRVGNC